MRLGPILVATAVAALATACSKSETSGSGGGETASTTTASPAPAISDEEAQKLLASLPAPYNTADLKNGKSKFSLCQSCHTLTEGGANMTGPNLWHIIGATAGEDRGGFKFSDAMTQSHIVWTPEKLDTWITKPQDMVPGTKMSFAGLKNAQDRTDVIAYVMVHTGYEPK
jgi:cytochrome c